MSASAQFIKPYCCINFKQYLSGVFMMMDNSCLMSIYHFNILHIWCAWLS